MKREREERKETVSCGQIIETGRRGRRPLQLLREKREKRRENVSAVPTIITIPQSPYGDSSLCTREPFDLIWLLRCTKKAKNEKAVEYPPPFLRIF